MLDLSLYFSNGKHSYINYCLIKGLLNKSLQSQKDSLNLFLYSKICKFRSEAESCSCSVVQTSITQKLLPCLSSWLFLLSSREETTPTLRLRPRATPPEEGNISFFLENEGNDCGVFFLLLQQNLLIISKKSKYTIIFPSFGGVSAAQPLTGWFFQGMKEVMKEVMEVMEYAQKLIKNRQILVKKTS